MAQQEQSNYEIFENADSLQKELGKAEGFLKSNQKVLTYVGGAILALVIGVLAYNYYTKSQDEEAQKSLFTAVNAWESDSLAKALKGDGANEGLIDIADNYGSSDAGNLARFYAGVALLKQGKYDDAIERLKSFSSSDLLLQGRAYSLIGDAYLEKKNAEEAISYYKKAVDYKANKSFTPIYLMKLASAQEVAKDLKGAVETYTSIIEKYPTSGEVTNAKKYKSMAEASIGE
jgi:predicted negative regulator of RcsB-dependent stress response